MSTFKVFNMLSNKYLIIHCIMFAAVISSDRSVQFQINAKLSLGQLKR